jgi:hypothetical protein
MLQPVGNAIPLSGKLYLISSRTCSKRSPLAPHSVMHGCGGCDAEGSANLVLELLADVDHQLACEYHVRMDPDAYGMRTRHLAWRC